MPDEFTFFTMVKLARFNAGDIFMNKLLWLFIAGGFGVLARFSLGGLIQRWHGGTFPIGTFVINVLG